MRLANNKYILEFLLLFGLTVLFIYKLSGIFSYVFLLAILVLFFRSKQNYFYFAYIFAFIESPGGLFYYGYRADAVSAPLFSLGPGMSLTFPEVFMIVAVFKALQYGYKTYPLVFKKELSVILAFIVILYLYSVALGMSLGAHITQLRLLLVFTFIYSFYRLIHDEYEFRRFFILLSTIAIFSFASQMILLTTGSDLVKLITGSSMTAFSRSETMLERPIMSPYLLILTYILSLFYLVVRNNNLNKNYLSFIAIISGLGIFLTATRGWNIAIFAILFLFMFYNKKPGLSFRFIAIGIFVFIIALSSTIFTSQINYAVNRMSTIEKLVKGDKTAGGTLLRLTERGPKVMAQFYESPIFGWGFSDGYGGKGDAHVGLQNTLAKTGVIGALIMLWFWYRFFYKVNTYNSWLNNRNPYKNALLIFSAGFLGLLVINASSTHLFAFYNVATNASKFSLLSFFIVISSFYLHYSIKMQNKQ